MATYTGHSYHDVLELAFAQFPRLGERRKQTAGTLSGGEQQMLSMARALATEPAVLLIDELSMGLAPIIVDELYEHVRRIAASGLSILIVEQFAHEILGLADRAGIMLHGRLLHTGPPASIAGELSDAYLGADHAAPTADTIPVATMRSSRVMNDENTDASGTMSSSRLSQFEAEVGKLKVTGGGANPERLGAQWGIGLTILGFVVVVISWWSALDAKGDNAAVECAARARSSG